MQNNNKKSLRRAAADFFLKSLIISSLCSFTALLYKKIAESISCAVFTSYDWISEKMMESHIARSLFRSRRRKRAKASFTSKISIMYEQSLFAVFASKLKWAFLTCQLNILAIFGLTFGFTSALVLILDNFAFSITKISLEGILSIINPLMTSLAFIIVAVFLMFSKKPLIRAINESLFFSFLFFDFFAMRKMPSADYENFTGLSGGAAALMGIVLGAVSLWLPPSTIAVIIALLIVFVLILHSPEAGVIGITLLLPFLSTLSLVFLVCSVALSFIIKCVRRKRIFKPDGLDLLVAIFAIFVLSGGIISVDIASSLPKMLVYLCFLSVYFIIKNIVRTEALIFSCARSVAVSSMAVAFIGIIQYILGNVSQIWQDAEMFGDIRGRTVSAFSNPNVLGEYLVLVIPAIFAMFLCSNTFKTKMLFFVTFALCSVCLVLTWSRGAWLGLIIASIVFILVKSHTFLAYITVALPGLTLAFSFIMNGKVMKRLFSIGSMADSSTAYRWNIWNGVWDMLADKGLYGIGTGEGAFTSVFPQYAVSGTESVPHTHSLYLQLMAETGVFSLLCFLLVCLAYFSLVFAYIRKAIGKRNRTMSIGFLCGILAFLLQGLTDYVWYSYKVYLFFWITLGFAMAVLNICKENDRRRYLH